MSCAVLGTNHNDSNFMESIRDQADNQAENRNRNINSQMGNVWYRGCHSGYMDNFGQNNHSPHYLQHGKRIMNSYEFRRTTAVPGMNHAHNNLSFSGFNSSSTDNYQSSLTIFSFQYFTWSFHYLAKASKWSQSALHLWSGKMEDNLCSSKHVSTNTILFYFLCSSAMSHSIKIHTTICHLYISRHIRKLKFTQ